MSDDGGVVIKITGDAKDLDKAVKDAKKFFGEMSSEGKKSATVLDNAFSSFLGNLSANLASGALRAGFEFFRNQLSGIIREGMDAESEVTQLNLAMANSGRYSAASSKGLQDFADELERTTTATGGAITKSAALIQTLTNLDEQGLKRATKAALDTSAALGMDLETAATLVGKGLEGNMEAFKKYGISLTSTGDKAKDLEILLGTLEKRFGGSAETLSNTTQGLETKLGNALDALKGDFGTLITSSPQFKAALMGAADVIQYLREVVDKNKDGIKTFVGDGVNLLVDGMGIAVEGTNGLIYAMDALNRGIGYVTDAAIGQVQVFNRYGEIAAGASANIREFFGLDASESRAAEQGHRNYIDALAQVREESRKNLEDEKKNADERYKAIQDFTTKAKVMIRERIEAAKAETNEGKDAFFQGLSDRQKAVAQSLQAESVLRTQYSEQEKAKVLEQVRSGFGAEEALRFENNMKKLMDEQKFGEALFELKAEQMALENEYRMQYNAETQAALMETVRANLGQQEAEEFAAQMARLESEKKYGEALKKLKAEEMKVEENRIFTYKKWDEQTNKEKLNNFRATMSETSVLMSSGSKELFAIGKAASIANATIAGYEAIQRALASGPFPLNMGYAAIVGAAQALNISRIAQQGPPTGMAEGGMVTGGIPGVDSVPLLAQRGEIVAPVQSYDEVIEGGARARGYIKGDENAETNSLLREVIGKLDNVGGFTIEGDFLADDIYIIRLLERINYMVKFRGAKIGA